MVLIPKFLRNSEKFRKDLKKPKISGIFLRYSNVVEENPILCVQTKINVDTYNAVLYDATLNFRCSREACFVMRAPCSRQELHL